MAGTSGVEADGPGTLKASESAVNNHGLTIMIAVAKKTVDFESKFLDPENRYLKCSIKNAETMHIFQHRPRLAASVGSGNLASVTEAPGIALRMPSRVTRMA